MNRYWRPGMLGILSTSSNLFASFTTLTTIHGTLTSRNGLAGIPFVSLPFQNSVWSLTCIPLFPIHFQYSVGKTFRDLFQVQAASPDLIINTAGYEDIPIDVHVPILDIQNLPDHPPNRTLSNVVVQGSFEGRRRDHDGIFHDLIETLDGASSGEGLP
jgi:hypothetical protein